MGFKDGLTHHPVPASGALTLRARRLSDDKGFTLIELMVVVVIIGLLAALVAPKFFGKVEQSRTNTAQAQIEMFGAALDQFRLDVGRYPTTSEGLESLRASTVENWHGSYLRKDVPSDPWGRAYIYISPGSHDDYDLISYGADGVQGGEDENRDVVSWKGLK